jgi:hypothetical protein
VRKSGEQCDLRVNIRADFLEFRLTAFLDLIDVRHIEDEDFEVEWLGHFHPSVILIRSFHYFNRLWNFKNKLMNN